MSQSADSRNTLTADLEDNGPCSPYLTCHGSRGPINFGHIRKDGGKHTYCTAMGVLRNVCIQILNPIKEFEFYISTYCVKLNIQSLIILVF